MGKDEEFELAFARRQVELLGTSRQRMMRRTARASMQRDKLLDAIRDAVSANSVKQLEQLLADVDSGAALWTEQGILNDSKTYREEK